MASNPLILFKARAGGIANTGDLFETTTEVEGYTTSRGTYVPPHSRRVKKKREAPKPPQQSVRTPVIFDLFGQPPADDKKPQKPPEEIPEADSTDAAEAAPTDFVPTHLTVTGEPVRPYEEDGEVQPDTWENADGEIIEDDNAFPISRQVSNNGDKPTPEPPKVAAPAQPVVAAKKQDPAPANRKQIALQVAHAARLRAAADKVIERADEELSRDRQANTHRRAGIAANAIKQAESDRAIGITMRNLADAIESGEARHLKGIAAKTHVATLELTLRNAMDYRDKAEGLTYAEQQQREGREPEPEDIRFAEFPELGLFGGIAQSYASDLDKPGTKKLAIMLRQRAHAVGNDGRVRLTEAEARDIVNGMKKQRGMDPWHLEGNLKRITRLRAAGAADNKSLQLALAEYAMYRSGARKPDPIKEAERALIGAKIPGYFPTPKGLSARLVEVAGIDSGMRVLEPSAGKGDIADAVRNAGSVPDVIEINSTLRTMLESKGFNLIGSNFMEADPRAIYDAVVMNPPFEHGQDMDHVQHAWDFVKPGGSLVSIMSEGTFFRTDRKAKEFRDWLDSVGGESEKLPDGSFLESDRRTGVNTRMVTIRKPDQPAPKAREALAVEHAEDKYDLAEALRDEPNTPKTRELIRRVAETEKTLESGGPKEGDTKVEDGVTYVLRDGRWHRETPEESADPAIEKVNDPEEALKKLRASIDKMGGREAMAERFKRAGRNRNDKAWAENIVTRLQESLDVTREQVLAELGLRDVAKQITPVRKKKQQQSDGGDFSDLDPNSPNYRYRDTGYIPGSRKEDAANAIKAAGSRGEQQVYTSIRWEELEKNPRQAKEVITKSNLFGTVDWEALKSAGMDPGAGFLIDRIYASIAPAPAEDTPQARQDYTLGLETLRSRLEVCKTADDVTKVLNELRDEFEGVMLNENETAEHEELAAIAKGISAQVREHRTQNDTFYRQWNMASAALSKLKWEQEKRLRRGWKPDPELQQKIDVAQNEAAQRHEEWMEFRAMNPEGETKRRDLGGGSMAFDSDLEFEVRKIRNAMALVVEKARLRNKTENPLHRAWMIMGDRFTGVLNYRRHKGSSAFAKHMSAAKSGKISDWSWLGKEVNRAPRVSKESARFQLRVAENYVRNGGRPITADSTMTLKSMFGLRDVQSGNWVLRDVNAAKFHVEQCSGAFADLADLIGVPDQFLSMNGRLAMAFGARGRGATGWADGAPRAHYEPVQRVINLTKMGGGGSLAHEWFHCLDNLLKEASGGGQSGKGDFVTEDPAKLPDPELQTAVKNLITVMVNGNHRLPLKVEYTARDYRTAKYNLERPVNSVSRGIRNAGNLQDAVDFVDKTFSDRTDTKGRKLHKNWRTLAAAWYDGKADGGSARMKVGNPMSSFALESIILDDGELGKNWSERRELAARAFQSWCEDRLEEQGRRNDYLSIYADNKYHVDPFTGMEWKPYPEGEERKRINEAFDQVVAVLRKKQSILKSLQSLLVYLRADA